VKIKRPSDGSPAKTFFLFHWWPFNSSVTSFRNSSRVAHSFPHRVHRLKSWCIVTVSMFDELAINAML
jgi:hypothetical protein